MDINWLTLTEAHHLMENGELPPHALVEACLSQINRLNPKIKAFIAFLPSDPFTGIHLTGSPLSCIPIALKDLFDVAGMRTTAGSRFFSEQFPSGDAHVVQKLMAVGAVILGKTNLHEIALGVTNVNPHYGTCLNPWDIERVTGGSSGGSAAAVATGMCLAALGTDTGGSIRIPSSLCGTVGLKPTYGRVSLRGVLPLSWNLDHVGPIARSVRDAALLLSELAGFDPLDPTSMDVPVGDYLTHLDEDICGWHVALGVGDYIEASDPEIMKLITQAAQVFKDLGAEIECVDLSWLADLALANSRMTQSDAAAFHRERLAEHPDWFGDDVRQRLQAGAALSSGEYVQARRTQAEGRRRFEKFFSSFDLLLLPTTPIPAPPVEGTQAIEAARLLTCFTSPFNLTGLPALSLPCGFTNAGLPTGLQIVSGPWEEAKVLRAGQVFEQATEWHDCHPKLGLD